jgi:hypothetical protein
MTTATIDSLRPDYVPAKPPSEGYHLDSCPFCGDGGGVSLEKPGDYRVRCWTCGASSTDAPNADYVIWAWNRRNG